MKSRKVYGGEETLAELERLGAQRLRLLEELKEVERQLAPVVRASRRLGVTVRRVQELTGFSSVKVTQNPKLSPDTPD